MTKANFHAYRCIFNGRHSLLCLWSTFNIITCGCSYRVLAVQSFYLEESRDSGTKVSLRNFSEVPGVLLSTSHLPVQKAGLSMYSSLEGKQENKEEKRYSTLTLYQNILKKKKKKLSSGQCFLKEKHK